MISEKPPIAVPKITPTRAGSKPSSFASSTASFAAASESTTLRASWRTSFGEAAVAGSKPFTSAAMRTGKALASKDLMKSMPLRPATAASQVERASFPIGVIAPRPVTATRRIGEAYGVPGRNVPFPPMEAELVEELPGGDGWQYEPKWDGFRGVLENDGGELALWSRNERPLLRYFPELRKLGDLLPPHSALDGEIVIELGGRLEFDAMQMRLHPAESRIRKLSAEIPARYIVFDILLWNGEPIHERPLAARRKELERLAKGFSLSPISKDPTLAKQWLERLEMIGLHGGIAKRLDLPYKPGEPHAVSNGKHHRTCDFVIVA